MAPPAKEPTVFCSECRIHYPNYMSYDAHRKRKMKAGESHIHCETCGAEFTHMGTLSRHRKQEHPREQDLNCPGCHLHFTRLGSLMNHIESNQCLRIGKGDIEEERLMRSSASKGIAEQGQKDPKEFFGKFPGVGSATAALGRGQRYLGYIESGGSGNPSSSITGPGGRAPVGSNPSTKTPTSQVQAIRGSDIRPGSLDTADFPTPAEASVSKKRIGEKNKGDSLKENAPRVLSSANDVCNTKAQRASGPDQQPGGLDVTGFPTIAEASAHKGSTEPRFHDDTSGVSFCSEEDGEELLLSKAKTLNDSRWAPNKTMAGSSLSRQAQSRQSELHPIYDRDILNKRDERDQAKKPISYRHTKQSAIAATCGDAQKQASSQQLATNETLAEQTETVPIQEKPGSTRFPSLHAQESSVGPIENSEVTSHFPAAGEDTTGGSSKALPPHLRAKFLGQGVTGYSQVSIRPADDRSVRTLPAHPQCGLDAGPTTANTEALNNENDASTIKHSDQGTMGLLPTSSRGSRGVSALPPHLRVKMTGEPKGTGAGGIESESSDGGVRLERREKASPTAASFADATTTQLVPESSMLTGKSIAGDTNSFSGVEQTQPSRAGETLTNTRGGSGLPPHLRVKPGFVAAVSPSGPDEAGCSPTPSMSARQSTPEPVGTGHEFGMGELSTRRGNFGVMQSVKSYSTVTKDNGTLAPHHRAKQAPRGVLPTDHDGANDAATDMAPKSHSGSRNATTQTDDASAILGSVALKPTGTSMDAVSTTIPEGEDIGLGPHDPQHPRYDARNYRSQYTGRFHCPLPLCGKGFKSMQGITGHLASDVHRRPLTKLQCPHCLRYFSSITALTQHSESEGRKCEIRNTNEFRHFLDHLTAGLADVEGKHEDDTNKYIVSASAQDKYGGDELERRMRNALEQQESKQKEDKAGNFYDDKTIHW